MATASHPSPLAARPLAASRSLLTDAKAQRRLRLAGQAVRRPASRPGLLRRSEDRRGRRRPCGAPSTSASTSRCRTVPPCTRPSRAPSCSGRIGPTTIAVAARPTARVVQLLAHPPVGLTRAARDRLQDGARLRRRRLGARALLREPGRRLRQPAATRRDAPVRGPDAADRACVQLRARRGDRNTRLAGSSTSSPRSSTRRPWSCRGAGAASRSCPHSSGGGWSAEGLGVRMANRGRLLAHHPGTGSVRCCVRTVDTPEPSVASRALPAESRAALGQSRLGRRRLSARRRVVDTRGNRLVSRRCLGRQLRIRAD